LPQEVSEIASVLTKLHWAVLSWLGLYTVIRAIPVLCHGDCWAPVYCVLGWMAVRAATKSDQGKGAGLSAAVTELTKVEHACSMTVDDYVMQVEKHLDMTRPPENSQELVAAGWRDASRPSAKLFLRFLKNPRKMHVVVKVCTQDQTKHFPLVDAPVGGRFQGGAIPIFWALGQWPLWFPFCDSTELLSQPAPDRAIWRVRFKIAMITVDAVLCCCLLDKLETTGCVEVVMWSPPNSKAGQEWLGITVPKDTAQFRAEFCALRLSLRATGPAQGEVRLQCDMYDNIGLDWLSVLFWQTACTRVVPLIARMQAKFAGSAIDKFYTGKDSDPNLRRLINDLGRRMHDRLSRAALDGKVVEFPTIADVSETSQGRDQFNRSHMHGLLPAKPYHPAGRWLVGRQVASAELGGRRGYVSGEGALQRSETAAF